MQIFQTYCVDTKVADSACSATAYLGGVKTNYATIGVNGHVARGDCVAMRNTSTHVHSIAKLFQDKGKSLKTAEFLVTSSLKDTLLVL